LLLPRFETKRSSHAKRRSSRNQTRLLGGHEQMQAEGGLQANHPTPQYAPRSEAANGRRFAQLFCPLLPEIKVPEMCFEHTTAR
jgi:hypothetical protein